MKHTFLIITLLLAPLAVPCSREPYGPRGAYDLRMRSLFNYFTWARCGAFFVVKTDLGEFSNRTGEE